MLTTMLKTNRPFSDNIINFYSDAEVIAFLSSQEYLMDLYTEMKNAENIAVIYPLVIPKSENEFIFDLMMIIKHEKVTEQGQWEIFSAENFVAEKINMFKLFEYIELTTKSEIKDLLHTIQQELKSQREYFKLSGKTFLEIDRDVQIIAFGCVKQ